MLNRWSGNSIRVDFERKSIYQPEVFLGTLKRCKIDKMFLAIVEKVTKKVDKHYEVPLPYRDGNLQLPNNMDQAIRRMQQMKKRFQKEPEFFNSYSKRKEEPILKEYGKRSSSNPIIGETWYLPPHHGVKHSSKLGRVRVVFRCRVYMYNNFE